RCSTQPSSLPRRWTGSSPCRPSTPPRSTAGGPASRRCRTAGRSGRSLVPLAALRPARLHGGRARQVPDVAPLDEPEHGDAPAALLHLGLHDAPDRGLHRPPGLPGEPDLGVRVRHLLPPVLELVDQLRELHAPPTRTLSAPYSALTTSRSSAWSASILSATATRAWPTRSRASSSGVSDCVSSSLS